jgi:hypothetical protein
MKFLKYVAILPIAFSCMGVAQAKSDIFYTVPFHNVEVKAANKIYVDYNFGAHTQTLVCTSDQSNDAITSLEWVYKDATRKIELPVTLKDDARFEGYYADPEGKLVITNDFGSDSNNGSIFVSCEYRNMK